MAAISRRTLLGRAALLAGLAAGAGLGLTRGVRHKVAVPPPPAPAALTGALARQQRLLAGYDSIVHHYGTRPAVAALRSDVVAHGNALRALLERYPGWRLARAGPAGSAASSPAAGSTGSGATSLAELAAASSADAAALTDAALAWPATEQHAVEVVPTLASIAACLASHLQVLA
jgi:hypothetical protein